MKTAAWFIVSELLLVLTIVLIFSNWQGSVNFSFAWPLSGSSFNITGGVHGGRVLLAFAAAVLTVATFFLGFIRMFARPKPASIRPERPVVVSPPAQKP